jgi:hypothetical protein
VLSAEAATDLATVRRHTRELIEKAATSERPVLIEAPPSSERTTAALELVDEIDFPVTYLAGQSDIYERARAWRTSSDRGSTVLPDPYWDCPTFAGENDGAEAAARRLYNKGLSIREVHAHEDISTPCAEGDSGCPYLETIAEIERTGRNTDLLIGKHHHAKHAPYVDNRVVVLDGFNTTPFQTQFSAKSAVDGVSAPNEVGSTFLEALANSGADFPTGGDDDLHGFLRDCHDPGARRKALAWFREHGITEEDVRDYDCYSVAASSHDRTHRLAPFLIYSLLYMRRIAPRIELAPPLNEGELRDGWLATGVDPEWRCLRDRTTGEMFVLHPPDLSDAAQVIGLDTVPTTELWNLLFARDASFDHRGVIDRDDFERYLTEALNIRITQLGRGMYHYAKGQMSPNDERRFEAIRALEGERFALISTKEMLEQYRANGWLDKYVKYDRGADGENDDGPSPRLARNYVTILSSNEFEAERTGAVFGTPYPGDDVVRRWAGFCGRSVNATGSGASKSFGEFGDEIYYHFAHHRVLRAAVRFGRHESVRDGIGTTVYLSTQATPDWFVPDREATIQRNTKETAIIETLIETKQSAERTPLADQTVPTLSQSVEESADIEDEVSTTHVRTTLERLASCDFVVVRRNAGRGGADLYRWDNNLPLKRMNDHEYLLAVGETIYVLRF